MKQLPLLIRVFDRKRSVHLLLVVHLFALIVLVDNFILLWLSRRFGNYMILAVSLSTGVIGLILISNAIRGTLRTLYKKVHQGSYPAREYGDVLVTTFAGICIILPGFFSDMVGAVLLIPPLKIVGRHIALKFFSHGLHTLYEYLKLIAHH